MKKNWIWIVIVVIVIVLVGGYLGRHRIKSMLGMNPAPQATQPAVTSAPTSSAGATSDNIYQTKTDSVKGNYMTDFQGMTLYTFDNDKQGVSSCYNQCATLWPFYTSGATAQSMLLANITVITRTDGAKQFAWKGMPLYYYSKDLRAGDINGDGVGGVWHIVKP